MLALMPLLQEAGVPAGVVNLVPSRASGRVVSAMLADGRVRVISFTGSTEVGRTLLKEAADNIVRPAMELGGNAPFIVCADANIDEAIEGAMIAKMRNIGEACTAANRFYVHEAVAEEFSRKLAGRMAALKMGHGLDEGVTVGPLVNAQTRDKVHSLVQEARQKGARVLTGGEPVKGKGYFYPATVLTAVPPDAALVREEIFGPVAAIQTFKSEEEMLRQANASEFGLASYVYTTRSEARAGHRREARGRHGGAQSRHGVRSRRALRRGQAERHRARGRPRRAVRVPGNPVRLRQLVTGGAPRKRGAVSRSSRLSSAPAARPARATFNMLAMP